jgi:hypothetical protein
MNLADKILNPEKPILYAIASEKEVRNGDGTSNWYAEIVHVHALDQANARFIFLQDPEHRTRRIVAIGPVIGYHVDDEHGDKLRA